MEKERRNVRPQPGRGTPLPAGRRTPPPSRPYPNARPYQTFERPIPPAQLQTRPAAQRYPALKPLPKTPTSAEEEEMEENFRDVLWSREREPVPQRRTARLLSLAYAAVHTLCALLFITPMNLLTARMPFPAADVVRALLPACIGSGICSLTRLLFPQDSKLMLLSYRRLLRLVLTVFVLLQMLLWGEWGAQKTLARFVLLYVAPPLVTGTALSVLLLYLDWRGDMEDEEDEEEDA